ncbi:MAG: hypothetical protein GXY51_08945 [Bacteroidetes bacterium]|jgi:hypothetical protein|nr:hypothetical protein [Bacteroidota bacterium]
MRTLKNTSRFLFVFIIYFISLGEVFAQRNQINDCRIEARKDCKVLGIHYYSLKEDIDPETFEQFVISEFNPVLRDVLPGITIRIMKEENDSIDFCYLMVYDISSLYVKKTYWPENEQYSDVFNNIWNSSNKCNEMYNRFSEMTEKKSGTDYIEVL